MKTILDNIVNNKKREVAELYRSNPHFEKAIQERSFDRSIVQHIENIHKPGVIAEFKRQSPSKGVINSQSNPIDVIQKYEKAGAIATSVLTDHRFFGGSISDLTQVRPHTNLPILRKDFIIDKLQIDEAAASGADIILLIASILTEKEVFDFTMHAKTIGLNVLLEVHDEIELQKACSEIDLLGINNRDLKSFTIDYDRSLRLLDKIDNTFIPISESGLSCSSIVNDLYQAGFKGFLMGEKFMKEEDPGEACIQFTRKLK
ncbi:indole-3-glycerol phosphate synthase TrpC [Halosquirtibacter laminarini]|uniref:Indole-3-glycerol phosphate synthase TrpC n=1 Tax=Halosquirtibacter laminarini TaxID=3374600 RepID=A0AC61NET6_9BACT|nr:indole-3-glycerol phosphate synthase TrpC [Prolixibacteraceae bacterium]